MKKLQAQALGIRVLLVLGMVLVLGVAGVDTPAGVSGHGGDASLVHLCVNDTDAKVRVVHPLPSLHVHLRRQPKGEFPGRRW